MATNLYKFASGTYPDNDKLSSKKFISLENIPSDEKNNNVKKEISGKPPVRVIVSYPQAEEWDGVQKSSSSCEFPIARRLKCHIGRGGVDL